MSRILQRSMRVFIDIPQIVYNLQRGTPMLRRFASSSAERPSAVLGLRRAAMRERESFPRARDRDARQRRFASQRIGGMRAPAIAHA
jgi:hypothetical protein